MNLLFCDNLFVFQVNAEMIALVSLGNVLYFFFFFWRERNVLYLMILFVGDALLSIYIVYILVHVFCLTFLLWEYKLALQPPTQPTYIGPARGGGTW